MLLRIDMDAVDPVWRQIADQVRALLMAGRLRPGARLATVRELALDLGVNHNTVAEAYRQRAAEGFVSLERGVGAVVLDGDHAARILVERVEKPTDNALGCLLC